MTNPNQPLTADQEALNLQRKTVALAEAQGEHKNPTIAYLLWWFTGILGGHRFYLGNTGMALGMLFTAGGLGIWSLVDAFRINKAIREHNEAVNQKYYAKHNVI